LVSALNPRKTACLLALVANVLSCGPMTVGRYPVHSAMAKPSSMDAFPHVPFEGRDAYLVGNDWFFQDPTYGWVLFDEEPPELRAYRERAHAPGAIQAH
jgi:hypothetical protein